MNGINNEEFDGLKIVSVDEFTPKFSFFFFLIPCLEMSEIWKKNWI